jgi:hypothetical protein
LAYTVEDAIAALASKQATLPADQAAYIEASVTIRDTAPSPITGKGPLYRTTLLGNLAPIWDPSFKFVVKRGGTGPGFLLGLDIEPLITIIGPVPIPPPAFITPFLQRHGLLSRKRYQGAFGQYLQPLFGVTFSEDQINPRLTGTIVPPPSPPGPIDPPGTIEVVLESVAVVDVAIG